MRAPTQEDAFLWVEGIEDQEVVWELRDQHNLPRNFSVKFAKGSAVLLPAFSEDLLADDRRIVGLVIDADDKRRWQAVCDRIQRAQLRYELPLKPDPDGTIIDPPPDSYLPRIGVWVMPDNQTGGELEDFVRACIPSNDALIDYANRALDEIQNTQLHRYRGKRSKAFIYTWLAWQEEPGVSMRKSFQKGALSSRAPLSEKFVDWMRKLFNPET